VSLVLTSFGLRSTPGYFLAPLRGAGVCAGLIAVLLSQCSCRNRYSSTVSIPASPSSASAPAFVAPGSDPWGLVWKDQNNATPALLTNGHIGVRIGPFGNCLDSLPMPMYWASNYERTGEERLRGMDCPLTISFAEASSSGDPTTIEVRDWSQSLDMSNGKIETSYLEHYPDGNDIRILTTSVIDPRQDSIAQQWYVSPAKDAKLAVIRDFDRLKIVGVSGNRVDLGGGKIVEVHYSCTPDVPQLSHPDFLSGHSVEVAVKAGATLSLSTVLNFYAKNEDRTTDVFYRSPPQSSASDGSDQTFADVAQASARFRVGENQPDIEIDGPVEDQQAVRSFIYYLRSGIDQTDYIEMAPVSPFGMSNDLYNGHVFWDADIWVFPALAFIDPDAARTIPEYRLAHEQAARNNFEDWISHVGPTADPKLFVGPKSIAGLAIGDKYPWESSISGRETVTGPSRFEEHISGDVAFMEGQAASLGLADEKKAEDLLRWVDSDYKHRSEKRADGLLGIRAVMSPDENHVGDNDLYTNLLAQWCSNGASWPTRSVPVAGPDGRVGTTEIWPLDYYLPQDSTSFLTYDNDPVKSYKQAAAVLSIYPLQYPPAEQQAKVMMDRFADKVIKNGPAMTDSVHAIIWARIGESDKAYDAWRHGWMDFVRPPFLLFSEKRGQDRTYFYTGAAGELQSVIYGFLGFRIDSKPEAGASWSLKLKGDRWLSIKPNLPKQWKRVTFRNFHVLGKTYTLTATHESVQVTQGD